MASAAYLVRGFDNLVVALLKDVTVTTSGRKMYYGAYGDGMPLALSLDVAWQATLVGISEKFESILVVSDIVGEEFKLIGREENLPKVVVCERCIVKRIDRDACGHPGQLSGFLLPNQAGEIYRALDEMPGLTYAELLPSDKYSNEAIIYPEGDSSMPNFPVNDIAFDSKPVLQVGGWVQHTDPVTGNPLANELAKKQVESKKPKIPLLGGSRPVDFDE